MNYTELLKRQLALDFNCAPDDFDRVENVLTASALNEGRRMYTDEKYFFQMATMGANAVLAADEVLHPFLREFMAERTGHWLFEQDKLSVLERELNKYGYTLTCAHHLYLPRFDVEPTGDFKVKWFNGREELEPFYDGRFYNALCERYLEKRPDIMAVCAYDGGEIMGMAGCSEDAPHFLQIGVDVFPKYRGRGVGTHLALLLKNEIIKRGEMPVYGTAPANIHSQNIALNCGFRPAWVEIEAKKIPPKAPELAERTWVDDMKQELEDYIEEQGIYIRQ
ncbi:MAG: GNAT family N-acetyltransferase [Ruminococcaceae bacterium]|nr:GNAT family N-acetyltransferase [Oscillospiraceae bacterium]